MDDQKKQQLKRERCSLENEIDQKLLALCKMDWNSDVESGLSSVESDIEASLHSLERANKTLVTLEASIVERQQNEHHREVMQGYFSDFKQTKAKLKLKHDKEELLKNCRKEIEDFKEMHGSQTLGKERDGINKISSMANQIMATAQSSRERLQSQRGIFGNILDKSGSLINRIPMVNDIIQKIHQKKSRDLIVLSIVIALCIFLIWLYWKN